MKSRIFFLFLLLFSALALTQEDQPSLFINTNSYHGHEIGHEKGLSAFAEIARNIGYKVESGWHWNITEDSLKDINVYVLPAFIQGISPEEKKVLRNYVRRGGSLLVISWFEDVSNLKGIMKEFDILFGKFDFDSQIGRIANNSPLVKPLKCSQLLLDNHRPFQTIASESTQVLAIDRAGKPVAIESFCNTGLGKVIACGDLGQFISPDYSVGNINKKDNRAFVYNLLHYLQAAPDLAVKRLKTSSRHLSTGDKLEVKIIISNIGDFQSLKTRVSVYLSTTNSLPEKGADYHLLKNLKIPALNPGKKKIIRKKLKTSHIAPGEYHLILKIDPDGKNREKVKDNNLFICKKQILISN